MLNRLLVCLTGLVTASSWGQQPRSIDMYVDDARPVAKAVTDLTSQFPGVVVRYEDPRYSYREDVKDITSEVRGDVSAGLPPILIPILGSLRFSYLALASGEPADWQCTLETILETYHQGSAGSRFQLLKTGAAYYIVPAQHRDVTGEWVPQSSVLDARITLGPLSTDGLEMVNEIVAAASVSSGETIYVGLVVNNMLHGYRGLLQATNEPAKDVLARTLDAAAPKLAWRLFYDPGGTRYFLNIHSVQEPSPPPAPALGPVPRPNGPIPANLRSAFE